MRRRTFLGAVTNCISGFFLLKPSLIKRKQKSLPPPKAAPLSEEEVSLINRAAFERLADGDSKSTEEIVDAVNQFTRTKMKEGGFYRCVIEEKPVPIRARRTRNTHFNPIDR